MGIIDVFSPRVNRIAEKKLTIEKEWTISGDDTGKIVQLIRDTTAGEKSARITMGYRSDNRPYIDIVFSLPVGEEENTGMLCERITRLLNSFCRAFGYHNKIETKNENRKGVGRMQQRVDAKRAKEAAERKKPIKLGFSK